MAGLNMWTIQGNVGKDAALRYTQTGIAVADFSVAITESLGKNEDGSKREKTTWVKVSVWRNLAEVCAQYVKKGNKILCVGSASGSAYTDKSGQPAFSLELTADKVVFLSSAGESNHADEPAAPSENIPF